MKKRTFFWIIILIMIFFTACGKKEEKSPVVITIWHYYNGTQKTAFDEMLAEFNDTVGREKGITVEGYSKGNINELEKSVIASIKKEPGSEYMPNIFATYVDTAYRTEKLGYLVNLDKYFTEEELKEYIESYIKEGRIGKNGELKIFPVAKSSEVFMINKTDWDVFAENTGASLEELSTCEGIAKVAKEYYEWTDALTPDILNDGKAFYGRDAMANLFLISSVQHGVEMFEVNADKVEVQIDKNVMKKIWDTYYIPYISGYFYSYGKFRSDDVQMGKILAFTGSTASAEYFPKEVSLDETSYKIEAITLPPPIFANTEKYAIQQGAGLAVLKGSEEEERASAEFLKWFTKKENNIIFAGTSCYLPVKKEANQKEVLDKLVEDNRLKEDSVTYQTLLTAFDIVNEFELYTNKSFQGGNEARKILEYHLSDKAVKDREAVVKLLKEGMSLEQAVSEYTKEECFEEWYEKFSSDLKSTIQ